MHRTVCPTVRPGFSRIPLLSLALALVVTVSIRAGDDPAARRPSFVDPLPTANLFAPETIRSDFVRLGITPFDDANLRFEILVPKTWESRPLTISAEERAADQEQFVPLAEIVPPDADNVLVEVRYIRLPGEVPLQAIVDHYAREGGFTVVAQQQGDYNGRSALDVLMTVDAGDLGLMAARFTLSRHGERVYLVGSSAPASVYDTYKKIFSAAAVSFAPAGGR